jgi:hypothetical protein
MDALPFSKLVRAKDAAAARLKGRREAYNDGYHGLRVLSIGIVPTPGAPASAGHLWRVSITAAGKRADPWAPGDDEAGFGGDTRVGARVRTRVAVAGIIRGQRVSMPAGLPGTVRSYVGSYRRVRLDARPEGTFVFRPPELEPLGDQAR